MSDLISVLQQINQDGMDAQKPADIAYGTVLSVSPLSVQTNVNMPPIPAAALVLTDCVVRREAEVQGGEGGKVVINEGLAEGDRVVMLRLSKGQVYVILSKVQGGA